MASSSSAENVELSDALASLCLILRHFNRLSSSFSERRFVLTPDVFVSASRNDAGAMPMMLALLVVMKDLSSLPSPHPNTQLMSVDLPTSEGPSTSGGGGAAGEDVKCWVLLHGYTSPTFLSIPTSVFNKPVVGEGETSYSREFLVAVSWLLASREVIDDVLKITSSGGGEDNRVVSPPLDDEWFESLDDDSRHKYLRQLYSNVRTRMNSLYGHRTRMVKLIDKCGGLALKDASSKSSRVATDPPRRDKLAQSYLRWKDAAADVYWMWMNDVSRDHNLANSGRVWSEGEEKEMRASIRHSIIRVREIMERTKPETSSSSSSLDLVDQNMLDYDNLKRIRIVRDKRGDLDVNHALKLSDINKKLEEEVKELNSTLSGQMAANRREYEKKIREFDKDIVIVSLLNRYHLDLPTKLKKK